MKAKVWGKKYFLLVLVGGAIPTVIILSGYFEISKKASIPIIIVLALVFASMALWAYSNRKADGSEWWQDESASGWRGY